MYIQWRTPSELVLKRARVSRNLLASNQECCNILVALLGTTACLSGGKKGDYQDCSVLYCVLKLCTVISTLRWAVLTVLWIGFCHIGPISLCIDLFVFISVYFVCFCFILHSCCIIVSMVGWTWWDWSLILRTCLLQCFHTVSWVFWCDL